MTGGEKDLWLVVENDDDDFLLFSRACSRALDREPCIHREKDGAAAKQFLAESRQAPRLIISDLNMPGMNGLEFLEWVRQQDTFNRVLFVMLSNSAVERDVTTARNLGADDYQVKPSEFPKFVSLIKKLNERQAAA